MAIEYPTRSDVISRAKSDLQNSLGGGIDPFLRNSMILSLATGYGGACYDNYLTIKQLQKEMFVNTADGFYLEYFGTLKNISLLPPTASSGYVSFAGVAGTIIPTGTTISSSDGLVYATLTEGQIAQRTLNVVSINRTADTATVVTGGSHNLATNDTVTISGADQVQYNGQHIVVVVNDTTFTYDVDGSPATPATTSTQITAGYSNIALQVQCQSLGSITNKDSGTTMYVSPTITGLNSTIGVCSSGLLGGADDENVEHYRKRVLYAWQNPVSFFSESYIVQTLQKIDFVDRVFVKPAFPIAGYVTIFFTTINGVIPNVSQISYAKSQLQIPVELPPERVLFPSLSPIVVNFTFSSISPSTLAMRDNIIANIEYEFEQNANPETNFHKYQWESAIYRSIDTATGEKLGSFTLSSPTADIVVGANQIAILGAVNL